MRTLQFRPAVAPLEDRLTPSQSSLFAVGTESGPPLVQVLRINPGAGSNFGSLSVTPVVTDFLAFESTFLGGVNVSVGDVTGDGVADLAVGAGAGGAPRVRVFRGVAGLGGGDDASTFDTTTPVADFFAYDSGFRGGVNVSLAPVGGFHEPFDGAGILRGILVTTPGAGGGPHVRAFPITDSGLNPARPFADFFAYAPAFAGGVSVAAVANDVPAYTHFATTSVPPVLRIMTGAGPGGGPHVKVFEVGLNNAFVDPTRPVADFFAFDRAFTGGVDVSARLRLRATTAAVVGTDIVVTSVLPGPGEVRVFDLADVSAGTRKQSFVLGPTGVLRTTSVYGVLSPGAPVGQIDIEPTMVVGVGGLAPELRLYKFTPFIPVAGGIGPFGTTAILDFRLPLPEAFRGGVNVG